MSNTILDMTQCTIIGENIPDNLWLEIVLAMVDIKNIRPISVLDEKSSYKALEKKQPRFDHLKVIDSMVYVFIHKEKRKEDKSKSAKFAPQAQKNLLVGYDGHTIYWVFLEQDNKIIHVKNFWIYKDAIFKKATTIPTYKTIVVDKQEKNTLDCFSDINALKSTSESVKEKRTRNYLRKSDVNVLITKLQKLCVTLPEDLFCPHKPKKDKIDSMVLFVKSLYEIEAEDLETFALVSFFDMSEPGTYEAAMSGPLAIEWLKALHEKYNSLMANDTWKLVKVGEVKPDHIVLSGKWVFKLKCGIDGNIIRFKAR